MDTKNGHQERVLRTTILMSEAIDSCLALVLLLIVKDFPLNTYSVDQHNILTADAHNLTKN